MTRIVVSLFLAALLLPGVTSGFLYAQTLSLDYSTYLGGAGNEDYGNAVSVDETGNAYVAGSVNSADFPTVNSYQTSYAGNYDA